MMDGLAERYYSQYDPQFQDSEHFTEVNDRASQIVFEALVDALAELTEEERESLAIDSDELLDMINNYI